MIIIDDYFSLLLFFIIVDDYYWLLLWWLFVIVDDYRWLFVIIDDYYWWLFVIVIKNFSSSIYKVIRPVFNSFFFFFTKRFHKYKKAWKRIQDTKNTINILGHFGFFQDKMLSTLNTLVFAQDKILCQMSP